MSAKCADCKATFPAGPASNHACMPDLADRLMYVIEGWASPDDWNVPSIYVEQIAELLACLKAGDDPRALRLMAKQTGWWNPNPTGWRGRTFWKHCPEYLSRAYAERMSYKRAR